MKFNELKLHPSILEGLEAMGFEEATPVQVETIPIILEGKDIIASAQTGTGKTAAFVLPVMHQIMERPKEGKVRALVIVPTRELAVQIDQQIQGFSYFTNVSSMPIYGGGDAAGFAQEKTALTSGVEFVIVTPGRMISHLNLGYVDFSDLDFLILDEADRMLDMGFIADINRIVSKISKDRQTLLFSATMPDKIVSLSRQILKNPERVNIALSKPAEGVLQGAYVVYDEQKFDLVSSVLSGQELNSVLIFSSTKRNVKRVYDILRKRGLNVGTISSDLEQKDREEVLLKFRNRKIKILVATDVVSRGIDIEGIDLVVNFDVPNDAEDYVHRIGRTARAKSTGVAITLISPDDQRRFQRIEELIGNEVRKLPVPEELGPVPEYKPRKGRSNNGGKRRFSNKSKGKKFYGKSKGKKRG